NDSVYVKINS
ncbi:hypothetical protein KM043_018896, partial [Ampulex compressa]